MTSSVGDRFGSYELLGVLGRGAMGTVFRARSSGGDIVALKVIKPELAHDAVFRRRFDHEARSAAKVSHEHIVGVVDVGEAEGLAYLAEDYVAGESLGDRLRREGPLALGMVVDVCLQVASGL
ncbi:MAG TPA: protein kinase, partial [Solirubrobacteraceae bacterium]